MRPSILMLMYWVAAAASGVMLYIASWRRWSNPPKIYPEWIWGLLVSSLLLVALTRRTPEAVGARAAIPRMIAITLLVIAVALHLSSFIEDYLMFGSFH